MQIAFPRLMSDTPESLAVQGNAPLAATYLGHKGDPSKTSLTKIEILDDRDQVLFTTEVGEGVYGSAIWCEGWAAYLKIPSKVHSRSSSKATLTCVFNFDDYAEAALVRYMGDKVCGDAHNPQLTNHPFVRSLLNHDVRRGLLRIRYYYTV